ncbi:hypothetical protein GCM10010399_07170 [Dactylosporangium fulvum]
MGVGAAFGAQAELLERVQPGDRAFDVPAVLAQTGTVPGAATGDVRGNAAGSDQATVLVVVVAAVGVDAARALSGPSSHAADLRDRVKQRQ